MDENLLIKLIKHSEGPLLDFKKSFYDYSSKKSKTDFVKDILALANSTFDEAAYILCGVTDIKEVVGIGEDVDIEESNWIQLLKSYSSHPVDFAFYRVYLKEFKCSLVVIKIFKTQVRPIICVKEYEGKLQKGAIYFRNGSVNDIATDLVTLEKMIRAQLKSTQEVISNDPTYNRYSKFPPPPYYNFFGRTLEIKDVYSKLINHHKNYLLSLTGDGGVGKTSIAYKIAEDIKNSIENGSKDFDDVIWISAKDQRIYFDERRELHREFQSIDDLINKILLLFYEYEYIRSIDKIKKSELLKQALEGYKYFFVLDNLEVFTDSEIEEINEFIQNAPSGHKFLLTSRHDLRVQQYVPVLNFDESITKQYILDVVEKYELEESDSIEIGDSFKQFYKLTNGNPLYIKYFIAQIKRGRKLSDILERRNVESEKSIKAYCFDSTLGILNDRELKLIYSLAVSDDNCLSLNEIKFITCLDNANVFSSIENLISLSVITKETKDHNTIYAINGLLKSYLLEEKRIPAAEYTNLYYRKNRISYVSRTIREDYAYNFGLMNLENSIEIISYNLILDEINSVIGQPKIDEIRMLHQGNYLVPFYKNFNKIRQNHLNIYSLYNEINTDFVSIANYITNKDEKIMMHIWKSILYAMLGKYDDIIQELNINSELFNNSEYESLAHMLKGTAYHMKAFDEYSRQQFKTHDEYRNYADELFINWVDDFVGKPFFHFIKRNIISSYNHHMRHLGKESNIRFNTFAFDIPILKGISLYK